MAGTTTDKERRHEERAERLRREAGRRRRQLIAVPVALVALAALVTALAWPPSVPSNAGSAQAASVATTSAPTPSAPATAAAEPTRSAPPTASVDASRSAEATSGSASSSGSGKAAEATGAVTIASIKPLKPAPGVKTIVVDKSEQRVTLYTAKGMPVDTFRCASGITYPRVGTYHVYGHRKQSSSMYDASTFYYFTMFVKSDKGNNIGFHSIPVMPDGKLVGKLGVPVSHGCVRLDKAKAKFVYSWATVSTKVVVKR